MVFDARDKEITLDDHARYVDTGTIGKVIDLKTADGVGWVKLEKTGLWYKSNLVEVMDEKDLKKRSYDDDDEIDIEKLKEKSLDFENMQMD